MATERANRAKRSDYLLIAAAVVIGFGASLTVGFFLDDLQTLENAIASSWNPRELAYAFTVFDQDNIEVWCADLSPTGFFRPLLILSFKIDHAIFGMQPVGFHLTNLALHLLNCYMLLWLLLRFGFARTKARLAAVLFALFCHNGVAVIWISGRTELLLATFLLASVLFYARARQSGRLADHLLSLGFAACALLTKESAVALPAYILGAEWILGDDQQPLKQRLTDAALRLAPVVALVLAFLVYRLGFYGALEAPPRPYFFSPTEPGFLPFLGLKTIYYAFAWVTTMPVMPVMVIAFLVEYPAVALAMATVTAVALFFVVRALRGDKRFWGLLMWVAACQVPVAMVMASSHFLYMGNAAVATIIAMLLMRGDALTRRARIVTGLVVVLHLGHAVYNVSGYHRLAHFNVDLTGALAELDDGERAGEGDLYLINLHLTGAHVGQRLRLLRGVEGLHSHLVSVSSEPFAFGPTPRYEWQGDRTLVLRFEEGLISSEIIQMLVMMGADLTPGRRHRSGPAWIEPRGESADAIDELVLEFDRPPDGSSIRVILLRSTDDGKSEAVSITPGGERSVTFRGF